VVLPRTEAPTISSGRPFTGGLIDDRLYFWISLKRVLGDKLTTEMHLERKE